MMRDGRRLEKVSFLVGSKSSSYTPGGQRDAVSDPVEK
jgi:hypothetical protein